MIRETVLLVVELAFLFFGVAFAIHLLHRTVGGDRIEAWMGGSALAAALKGIAVGFVTPFCTFSAVPMLVGFRQANVRTAGYVAFIVAAPVLDLVLFWALVLIVGLAGALVYVAVAFAAALTLALVADAVGIDQHLKSLAHHAPGPSANARTAPMAPAFGESRTPLKVTETCDARTCAPTGNDPWQGWRREASSAAVAATALLRSVAAVLAIGVVVGLAIEELVSPEMAARMTASDSLIAIPAAAILGTPLYFSTALFVPIANALTAAGVGSGAIVALTISGAGASLPEFLLLTKFATAGILAVFFLYVLVVAVAGGLLVEAMA